MKQRLASFMHFVKQIGLPRSWLNYLFVISTQAVFALTLIWFSYPTSRAGIPMHLLLLTFIVTVLYILFKPISRFHFLYTIATTFTLTALQVFLLAAYALNFFGHKFIGSPIDFNMAWGYIGSLSPFLLSMGQSPIFVVFCCSLLICICGLSNFLIFKKRCKSQASSWPLYTVLVLFALSYVLTKDFWPPREPLHIFIYGPEITAAPKGLVKFSEPRLTPRYAATTDVKIKPRPLILITVDALRSDFTQVYANPTPNTPFLSGLAKSGKLQRIDHAKSICTVSYCGLVGLLSSRYWAQLNRTPDNLPDVLSAYGYKSYFLLGGDHQHFYNLRRQYGENITIYKDGSTESGAYPNDDRLIDKWLADFKPENPSKSFLYIHLMSVHEAGMKRPEFHVNIATAPVDTNKRIDGFNLSKYQQNYNNGILQADDHIRKIFDWLSNQGWLDEALVIISSDHGEYLGEFNKLNHGGLPYEPAINIPLLVYDMKNKNYPARTISSQVDIAPTFLNAIQAPIPLDWSGIPLQQKTKRCAVASNSYNAESLIGSIDNQMYKYLKIDGKNTPHQILNLNQPEDHQTAITDEKISSQLISCLTER